MLARSNCVANWNTRRGGKAVYSSLCRQNTSRKCPECGHVSTENRKSQAKFVCVECGFSANADFVVAVNIREAGLASLACLQPLGDVSPSCQEPTEGVPA